MGWYWQETECSGSVPHENLSAMLQIGGLVGIAVHTPKLCSRVRQVEEEGDLGRHVLVVVAALGGGSHPVHAVHLHAGGLGQRVPQGVQELQLRAVLGS